MDEAEHRNDKGLQVVGRGMISYKNNNNTQENSINSIENAIEHINSLDRNLESKRRSGKMKNNIPTVGDKVIWDNRAGIDEVGRQTLEEFVWGDYQESLFSRERIRYLVEHGVIRIIGHDEYDKLYKQ